MLLSFCPLLSTIQFTLNAFKTSEQHQYLDRILPKCVDMAMYHPYTELVQLNVDTLLYIRLLHAKGCVFKHYKIQLPYDTLETKIASHLKGTLCPTPYQKITNNLIFYYHTTTLESKEKRSSTLLAILHHQILNNEGFNIRFLLYNAYKLDLLMNISNNLSNEDKRSLIMIRKQLDADI